MSRSTDEAKVVAAIDVGTTSSRCMLFDRHGRMVSIAQLEQKQSFPRPGWVEQNAHELWVNVQKVVPKALALAGRTPSDVAALGVANQRETTVIWDRRTGRPLAPAITWQDTRTGPMVDQLGEHASEIRDVTGLIPRPTLPLRVCDGCSTTSVVPKPQPNTVTCCSGRWRRG